MSTISIVSVSDRGASGIIRHLWTSNENLRTSQKSFAQTLFQICKIHSLVCKLNLTNVLLVSRMRRTSGPLPGSRNYKIGTARYCPHYFKSSGNLKKIYNFLVNYIPSLVCLLRLKNRKSSLEKFITGVEKSSKNFPLKYVLKFSGSQNRPRPKGRKGREFLDPGEKLL